MMEHVVLDALDTLERHLDYLYGDDLADVERRLQIVIHQLAIRRLQTREAR